MLDEPLERPVDWNDRCGICDNYEDCSPCDCGMGYCHELKTCVDPHDSGADTRCEDDYWRPRC